MKKENRFDNIELNNEDYKELHTSSLKDKFKQKRNKKSISVTLKQDNIEKVDRIKNSLDGVSRSTVLDYIIEQFKE